METNSAILFIGGTGYIGKFIVEASVKSGHPTYVLVRQATMSNPTKSELLKKFKTLGATLLIGDLYDHESLVNAVKLADVVISTVGYGQLADQENILSAIKEAGNVKRFLPSEFGYDPDRNHTMPPVKYTFAHKIKTRRSIEAQGIPYTYIVPNFFAGKFLRNLSQPGASSPPSDKMTIFGDGNTKAVYTTEEDIATYTIRTINDERTLNKTLYVRCPENILSQNELAAMWEGKIGKTLQKTYVAEEEMIKNIKEGPVPLNAILSVCHAVHVVGDHTNFKIEPSFGEEASNLYPEVKYTTADEYLCQLA